MYLLHQEMRDACKVNSESLGVPCSLCSQCREGSLAEEWEDWVPGKSTVTAKCCRWAEPSGCAHETTTRTQNSRMVRTCWSEMVAAEQTDQDLWKFSAVSAVAATADLVENEPNRSSRRTRNARSRGSSHGSNAIQTTETHQIWTWVDDWSIIQIWKQFDGWSIASLQINGRGMERIRDWFNGADDARVENTKTVMLDVETNDNIDKEKMWKNRDISDITTWSSAREAGGKLWKKHIFEWMLMMWQRSWSETPATACLKADDSPSWTWIRCCFHFTLRATSVHCVGTWRYFWPPSSGGVFVPWLHIAFAQWHLCVRAALFTGGNKSVLRAGHRYTAIKKKEKQKKNNNIFFFKKKPTEVHPETTSKFHFFWNERPRKRKIRQKNRKKEEEKRKGKIEKRKQRWKKRNEKEKKEKKKRILKKRKKKKKGKEGKKKGKKEGKRKKGKMKNEKREKKGKNEKK